MASEVASVGAVEPARIEAGAPAMYGCSGLVVEGSGVRCLLRKPKPLQAWLAGRRDTTIEVRLDDAPIAATLVRDRDGLLVQFDPGVARGRVELRASSGEVWRIELAPTSARYVELRSTANAQARAGDSVGMQATFATGAAELGAEEAVLLRCEEAHIASSERRYDRVLAIADEVARSPVRSCVGISNLLRAYVLLFEQPDFNAAEVALASAEAVAPLDFKTATGVRYLRGVFDHRIGKLDESLEAFEESARLAALVGDDEQFMASATMQAVSLARLGRLREAEAVAASLEQRFGDQGGTLVRDVRFDLAWIALLRRELDDKAPDPSAMLRELVADYTRSENFAYAARARLHLVLALLQSQETMEAQREFEQIDHAELDGHSRVWYELAGFELAKVAGRQRAAKIRLERADFYADLTHDGEHHFRIWAARGALARTQGDRRTASDAFHRASEIADELALAVPGSSGRSMMVTTHLRADAELIDLLIESNADEDAVCAAVGVRARHLRGVWARLRPPLSPDDQREYQTLLGLHRAQLKGIDHRLEGAWALPGPELELLHDELEQEGERADELLRGATALLEHEAPNWSCERIKPKQVGAAVLTMAPSASQGRWWFMLWRRDVFGTSTTIVDVVDVEDPTERAAQAMALLGPTLADVDHLVVIPVGELTSVDFHVLALAPGLAPSMSSIVYSLGFGDAGRRMNAGSEACVVAGSSDLAAVSKEIQEVEAGLAALGWPINSSWMPTGDDQPLLLHYAGHGYHTGDVAWDSYIEIPGYGRLNAAQIVAAQRSPNLVVLGACSTGAQDPEALDGGMNLAVAFVLAGAELVLAPSGPVDDQTALSLSRRLYSTLRGRDAPAFIEALTLAQREQLASDGGGAGPRSFASWRAWQP
ncbi:CHAT domain-containing protein [Nannocystaceae bacterium ST9]